MRFAGPLAASFQRSRELGLRGVTHDGETYTCHECGRQWRSRERVAWWPISLRWSWPKRTWLSWHGAEIGSDGIEQRVFAKFLRIGPVIVCFGWREAFR